MSYSLQESTTSAPAEPPSLDARLELTLHKSHPDNALDDSLDDSLPNSLDIHADNQDLQAADDCSVPDSFLHSDLDIDVQLFQDKKFQSNRLSSMQDDDNDFPPSDFQMDSLPDILNDESEPLPYESSQPSSSPSDGLSSFRSTSPSSVPAEYSETEPVRLCYGPYRSKFNAYTQLNHVTIQTNEQLEVSISISRYIAQLTHFARLTIPPIACHHPLLFLCPLRLLQTWIFGRKIWMM